LPALIAAVVGEIHERGRGGLTSAYALGTDGLPGDHALPADADTDAEGDGDELEPFKRSMPSARITSVALMAMLAFGVLVGSLTGTGAVGALADSLLLAVAPPHNTAAPSGGSGGGGGSQSGGSSSSSPSAAATSQAPAQQQTIAVPASTTPSTAGSGGGGSSSSLLALPPIKHVFEIVLSNQGYDQAFVSTAGHPYLAKTLRNQGELLADYYGVASSPLANEIALVSGQGPTQQTVTNCPAFTDIAPAGKGSEGQVLGNGCVYPAATLTLANQLTTAGYRWKAYVQGQGDAPKGQPATCRHPAAGSADTDQAVRSGDPYVTPTNPFVYFHSLINTHQCSADDVDLSRLKQDLTQTKTTPAFSYIAASPCDDGSDQPCSPGAPSGLAAADGFLKSVVPEIEHSAAYKSNGLIAITFDQAPQTGQFADSSSCCNNPTFPNLNTGTTPSTTTTTGTSTSTSATGTSTTGTTSGGTTSAGAACPITTGTTTATTPTTTTPTTASTTSTTASTTSTTPCPVSGASTTPGGGQVGLLLISRYVKPGSLDDVDTFNHFSLLKSVEDLFGLKHLGYASDPALPVFDGAIFNAGKK